MTMLLVSTSPVSSSPVQGFTLIELLVVISIIAILAAILLPTVNLVRDQAKSMRCLSAQRQLGLAFETYAQDQDGMMPSMRQPVINIPGLTEAHWFQLLAPYVSDGPNTSSLVPTPTELTATTSIIWGCPACTPAQAKAVFPAAMYTNLCYGMNTNPWMGPVFTPTTYSNSFWSPVGPMSVHFTWSTITRRAQRILVGDSTNYHLSYLDPLVGDPYNRISNGATNRHHGRANYVFFDLHAAAVAKTSAYLGLFDPDSMP